MRERDLVALDTFALPEILGAIGDPRGPRDARTAHAPRAPRQRAGTGRRRGRRPPDEVRRDVADWREWWFVHATDFVALDGADRAIAVITETRYGKWLQASGQRRARRQRDRRRAHRRQAAVAGAGDAPGVRAGHGAQLGARRPHRGGGRVAPGEGLRRRELGGDVPALRHADLRRRRAPAADRGGARGPRTHACGSRSRRSRPGSLATCSRWQRAAMLDIVRQDFVRTAHAKGLSGSRVLVVHALRNALMPTVTLAGLHLPALLGGAFVVEEVFGLPGMGYETLRAIEAHDAAWLMAVILVAAVAITFGLVAQRRRVRSARSARARGARAPARRHLVSEQAPVRSRGSQRRDRPLAPQAPRHRGDHRRDRASVARRGPTRSRAVRDDDAPRARAPRAEPPRAPRRTRPRRLPLVAVFADVLASNLPDPVPVARRALRPPERHASGRARRRRLRADGPPGAERRLEDRAARRVRADPRTTRPARCSPPLAQRAIRSAPMREDATSSRAPCTARAPRTGWDWARRPILVLLGVALGALAGFAGGAIDTLVTRTVESFTAIPTLVLVLIVGAMVPHPTTATLLWTIALDPVDRSRSHGARRGPARPRLRLRHRGTRARRVPARVLRRHVLPNAIGPAIVAAAFGIASVVLIEAAVDFLHVGPADATASWGEALGQARGHPEAWWLIVFPGSALLWRCSSRSTSWARPPATRSTRGSAASAKSSPRRCAASGLGLGKPPGRQRTPRTPREYEQVLRAHPGRPVVPCVP